MFRVTDGINLLVKKSGKLPLEQGQVERIAFPHNQDLPPGRLQGIDVARVSTNICFELVTPIIEAGFRHRASLTAHVPMPEAAMDEDNLAAGWKNQVRGAR